MYSIGYRHPAVLAKAITAIDLISGGRAAMGIGAGWAEVEYQRLRHRLPAVGDAHGPARGGHRRAARPAPRRGDDVRGHSGSRSTTARNEPRPIQDALPIWIGGGGEKRTLRIAARYADGWNVPFVDPATFAAKRDVLAPPLRRRRPRPGRDRAAPSTSGWRGTRTACASSSARSPTSSAPACSAASVDQVVDRIGEYVDAGADQVNLALRAPFDVDALEQFSNTARASR